MKLPSIPMPQRASLKLWWRSIARMLVICSGLAIGGVCAFSLDSLYRIHSIEVESDSDRQIVRTGTLQGTFLLFITPEQISSQIREYNRLVREAKVRIQLPDKIYIQVSWYRPLAQLAMRDGYFTLSKEGVIVSKSFQKSTQSLIPFTYYQQLSFQEWSSGERLPMKDIQTALYFYSHISSFGLKVQHVDIRSFHMIGLYSDTQTIMVSAEKDLASQEYQLMQTFKLLSRNKKVWKKIDVRFDKPVVSL